MNILSIIKKLFKKLSSSINCSEDVVNYIFSNDSLPEPLTDDDEKMYIGMFDTINNDYARSKLIEHNLRLVLYIAKKFETPKIDLEDLGFYFGRPCSGHWEATVGDKVLSNGNMYGVAAYNLKYFMNKVAKEAEKLNPKKLSSDAKKIQAHKDAIELIRLKKKLKDGKNEIAIRDNLLDQIFELIRIK